MESAILAQYDECNLLFDDAVLYLYGIIGVCKSEGIFQEGNYDWSTPVKSQLKSSWA
jgi:hypothetical protein